MPVLADTRHRDRRYDEALAEDSGVFATPRQDRYGREEHPGIVVVDCYGTERPFNSAVLATGILAIGMEAPVAHQIAHDVWQHLSTHHITRIDSAELVLLTAERIASRLTRSRADLYTQWNRARRLGGPLVVALSGANGIGKSTLATRVALRLGIHEVVTTGTVREVLRTIVPPQIIPELHESLLEAGSNQAAVYTRQAEVVTEACASVAKRCIREGKSVLFEGTHLLPGALSKSLRGMDQNPVIIERLLFIDDGDIDIRQARNGSSKDADVVDEQRSRGAQTPRGTAYARDTAHYGGAVRCAPIRHSGTRGPRTQHRRRIRVSRAGLDLPFQRKAELSRYQAIFPCC